MSGFESLLLQALIPEPWFSHLSNEDKCRAGVRLKEQCTWKCRIRRGQNVVGQSSEPDPWARSPPLKLGDPGWLPRLTADEIAGKMKRVHNRFKQTKSA